VQSPIEGRLRTGRAAGLSNGVKGFTKKRRPFILFNIRTEIMKRKNQRIRERNILEIVRGLLLSEVAFQEIFKKYKEGSLHFSDIGNWVDDKGQNLLYDLKEKCHSLFRYMGKETGHKNEWLLDLAIGSIFHEAMKLRENIYQMEVYRPRYLQYKLKAGKSTYEKDYLQQFERIISRAEQGVAQGVEETRSLFRDAMAQLVDFFKENSKNPILVRFLLEHQILLRRVYGSKRMGEIFNLVFEKGLLDAYDFAGRSYLQGGHYDLSSFYFSKALKIDAQHRDLQFLLNFSLGMNAYYNNLYSKALSHFAKLIHLKSNVKGKKEYLRKVEDVCRKVSSELKEGKSLKGARKANSLADQVKKML
jgi:tetratricopeptide (TPR) repeat protein